jgi:hypothetical protein
MEVQAFLCDECTPARTFSTRKLFNDHLGRRHGKRVMLAGDAYRVVSASPRSASRVAVDRTRDRMRKLLSRATGTTVRWREAERMTAWKWEPSLGYPCLLCPAVYQQMGHLNRHYRVHHGNERGNARRRGATTREAGAAEGAGGSAVEVDVANNPGHRKELNQGETLGGTEQQSGQQGFAYFVQLAHSLQASNDQLFRTRFRTAEESAVNFRRHQRAEMAEVRFLGPDRFGLSALGAGSTDSPPLHALHRMVLALRSGHADRQ